MTHEGEEVYSATATEPEEVVYLHLTPLKPYTNVVEGGEYVIKAYYLDDEIWKGEIEVKGVKPSIEVLAVKGEAGIMGLHLKSITVRVENAGDVPLYVTTIPENIEVNVDGEEIACTVETTTILPGEAKEVEVDLLAFIRSDELGEDHIVEVEVAGEKAEYVIPKLEPELELLDRKYEESLGTSYLDSVSISVTNDWVFPVHVNWIKVFVDGKECYASVIPEEVKEIDVGKTVELTLKLPLLKAKKGSNVKIVLGASSLELKA